jgi:hypothetical protein
MDASKAPANTVGDKVGVAVGTFVGTDVVGVACTEKEGVQCTEIRRGAGGGVSVYRNEEKEMKEERR